MIKTKKELKFYYAADLMMNRGYFKPTVIQKIMELIDPDWVIRYLRIYRKMNYLENSPSFWHKILFRINNIKKNRLGAKLGFYIGGDYGYGLVIPHYGTVVAGGHVGNYAVLHSSICVTGRVRTIGDGLYVSTGAKIVGDVKLGNNITVGPNAVVEKGKKGDNLFLDGMPANIRYENYPTWYVRDGFEGRVRQVEELRQGLGL
jgi:serine O-acetyltransferase